MPRVNPISANTPLRSAEHHSTQAQPGVTVLPLFDDNRSLVLECAALLKQGDTLAAYIRMTEAWQRSRRIASDRYTRLSDYLRHALLAIETGEFEGSRYVLLSAATAFGWTNSK